MSHSSEWYDPELKMETQIIVTEDLQENKASYTQDLISEYS